MRINGGTVAVVTGAAGGLGRALTAGLLARGAKVAAWDVAEGVHSWPGVPAAARSRIEPMRVDVTDSEGVLSAAAALPRPNPVARAAAAGHDVRRQAERIEGLLARAVADG